MFWLIVLLAVSQGLTLTVVWLLIRRLKRAEVYVNVLHGLVTSSIELQVSTGKVIQDVVASVVGK
jgi:hypothetical protein